MFSSSVSIRYANVELVSNELEDFFINPLFCTGYTKNWNQYYCAV